MSFLSVNRTYDQRFVWTIGDIQISNCAVAALSFGKGCINYLLLIFVHLNKANKNLTTGVLMKEGFQVKSVLDTKNPLETTQNFLKEPIVYMYAGY